MTSTSRYERDFERTGKAAEVHLGGHCFKDPNKLRGLPGERGKLLDAIYGDAAAFDRECEEKALAEARDRRHVFVLKYRCGLRMAGNITTPSPKGAIRPVVQDFVPVNPFQNQKAPSHGARPGAGSFVQVNPFRTQDAPPAPSVRKGLPAAEYAELHAAFDYAEARGLYLNAGVTMVWRMLDAHDDGAVQVLFRRWLKCLRAWTRDHDVELLYAYVHETGRKVGPHTHLRLHMPMELVAAFRAWVKAWTAREVPHAKPRAVRVRADKAEPRFQHWLGFHYLVKGYDRSEVVVPRHEAPDGRAVLLGDVVAFSWHDPGVVTLTPAAGCSRSLGAGARARGLPAMVRRCGHCGGASAPPFTPKIAYAGWDVRNLFDFAFRERIAGNWELNGDFT